MLKLMLKWRKGNFPLWFKKKNEESFAVSHSNFCLFFFFVVECWKQNRRLLDYREISFYVREKVFFFLLLCFGSHSTLPNRMVLMLINFEKLKASFWDNFSSFQLECFLFEFLSWNVEEVLRNFFIVILWIFSLLVVTFAWVSFCNYSVSFCIISVSFLVNFLL